MINRKIITNCMIFLLVNACMVAALDLEAADLVNAFSRLNTKPINNELNFNNMPVFNNMFLNSSAYGYFATSAPGFTARGTRPIRENAQVVYDDSYAMGYSKNIVFSDKMGGESGIQVSNPAVIDYRPGYNSEDGLNNSFEVWKPSEIIIKQPGVYAIVYQVLHHVVDRNAHTGLADYWGITITPLGGNPLLVPGSMISQTPLLATQHHNLGAPLPAKIGFCLVELQGTGPWDVDISFIFNTDSSNRRATNSVRLGAPLFVSTATPVRPEIAASLLILQVR